MSAQQAFASQHITMPSGLTAQAWWDVGMENERAGGWVSEPQGKRKKSSSTLETQCILMIDLITWDSFSCRITLPESALRCLILESANPISALPASFTLIFASWGGEWRTKLEEKEGAFFFLFALKGLPVCLKFFLQIWKMFFPYLSFYKYLY